MLEPDGVRRLLTSVDAGARAPLDVLREIFTSTHDLEKCLEKLGTSTEFWSRIG